MKNEPNYLRIIFNENPKGKFVALYSDGSGANIFALTDSGDIITADGDIQDNLDDYLFWIPLPDDFKFFCEDAIEQRNEKKKT